MHRDTASVHRDQLLAEVEKYLADAHGIAVAGALGFENSYALAMRRDRARELGVTRISELARRASELEIGGDYEFFARAEWKSLVAVYGLAFRAQRAMDPSLMYGALREREVDVISAYSTDGRIEALGLAVLEDDLGVIPPYDAIVLASRAPRARASRGGRSAARARRNDRSRRDAPHERRGRRGGPVALRRRARLPRRKTVGREKRAQRADPAVYRSSITALLMIFALRSTLDASSRIRFAPSFQYAIR